MRIVQPAHVRLQQAITDWLESEVPESAALFKEGVVVGDSRFTHDYLSLICTNAVIAHVEQALETLGLASTRVPGKHNGPPRPPGHHPVA
jgi:hypothetical protein